MRTSTVIRLYAFFGLVLLAAAAWACPNCAPAAEGGSSLFRGWSRSIALMMAAPYVLFVALTVYVVRSNRRPKK